MPSVQKVKDHPDNCKAIQTTRELYCQVDEAMARTREDLEGSEQSQDFLDKLVHPKSVAKTCWKSITQREAIRDFDGNPRFRKVAFQPHQAVDGIEGDPADGWDNERSEKYTASLAHSGQQLACHAVLTGLETQLLVSNLWKKVEQQEETIKKLSDLRERLEKVESDFCPKVEVLEDKVGDRGDIAGDLCRVNKSLHILTNALGEGDLKDKVAAAMRDQ